MFEKNKRSDWVKMVVCNLILCICILIFVRAIEMRGRYKKYNIYGDSTYICKNIGNKQALTREEFENLNIKSKVIDETDCELVLDAYLFDIFVPRYENTVMYRTYSRSGSIGMFTGLYLGCGPEIYKGRSGSNSSEVVTYSNHKIGDILDIDGKSVTVVGNIRDTYDLDSDLRDSIIYENGEHDDIVFFTDSIASYSAKSGEVGTSVYMLFERDVVSSEDMKVLDRLGETKSLKEHYGFFGTGYVYILCILPVIALVILCFIMGRYIDELMDSEYETKEKLKALIIHMAVIIIMAFFFGYKIVGMTSSLMIADIVVYGLLIGFVFIRVKKVIIDELH